MTRVCLLVLPIAIALMARCVVTVNVLTVSMTVIAKPDKSALEMRAFRAAGATFLRAAKPLRTVRMLTALKLAQSAPSEGPTAEPVVNAQPIRIA